LRVIKPCLSKGDFKFEEAKKRTSGARLSPLMFLSREKLERSRFFLIEKEKSVLFSGLSQEEQEVKTSKVKQNLLKNKFLSIILYCHRF